MIIFIISVIVAFENIMGADVLATQGARASATMFYVASSKDYETHFRFLGMFYIDWLYIFYSSILTKYIKVSMQCNNMIQYTY